MVLGLSCFFLFYEALRAVFQLPLHLLFVHLDAVLVPLNCPLVLCLHLLCLSLCKLDLLLHQSAILLIVDVLVVELVLFLLEFSLQVFQFLRDLNPVKLVLLLLLVYELIFRSHLVALRFNLVLKSDFLAFQIGNLLDHGFVLVDQLSSLRIVGIVLLLELDLVLLRELLEGLNLLSQLLVIGLKLLG